MKQTALLYFDGTNVMLIREQDLMEPPKIVDKKYTVGSGPGQYCSDYRALYEFEDDKKRYIETAKSKAIRVENAECAGDFIRLVTDRYIPFIRVADSSRRDEVGKTYDLPEGYTYEVQCECNSPSCDGTNKCIIKPVVVLPEEGEDELWREAASMIWGKAMVDSALQSKEFQKIKSHFKLTRQ